MRNLLKKYDKFEEVVLVASLAITVTIIFVQVVMRRAFNNSLTWSEELARYMFIWQIWLGISIGFREKAHIRVEIVLDKLKGTSRVLFEKIISVVLIVFLGFLASKGFELVKVLMANGSVSPSLAIPLWIIYLSLPFSCAVSVVRLCLDLVGIDSTPDMTKLEKEGA